MMAFIDNFGQNLSPWPRLKRAVRWWLAAMALAFGPSALAATYTLSSSGPLPSGCSRVDNTHYTCSNLFLNYGDAVNVANANTTLTVTGTLSVGGNAFNWTNPVSGFVLKPNYLVTGGYLYLNGSLQLTGGGTALSYGSQITGSISAAGTFISGGGSTYGGSITTTNATLVLGSNDTVAGNLNSAWDVVTASGDAVAGNVTAANAATLYGTYGGSVTAGAAVVAANGTQIAGPITGASFDGYGAGVFGGPITTTTGYVALRYGDVANGNVSADTYLSIDGATVNGNATAQTTAYVNGTINGTLVAQGNITTAWGAKITGAISGNSFFSWGNGVFGSTLATTGGAVTLGINDSVASNVVATGTATLYGGAKVGGNLSTSGNVSLLSSGAVVNGNVTSAGSVTIWSASSVGGDVTSGGTVWLTAGSARVGGNISASGQVTLDSGAYVGGGVTSDTGATLNASGVIVEYCIRAPSGGFFDTINLWWPTRVGGVCCVSGGGNSCNSSCVNAVGVSTPPVCNTTVASAFTCVESNATDPVNGHLNTKLDNTSFTVDVVALTGSGGSTAQYTGFSSDQTHRVTVELVSGSSSTDCASRTAISDANSQTLRFHKSDYGRTTSAAITVQQAHAELWCRVTDLTSTPQVTACSRDDFSVRPRSLAVSGTAATSADTTGTSAIKTPVTKAGAPFTLYAQSNVAGYSGTPTVDGTKVSAHSGGVAGTVTPNFGAADPSTGLATSTAATYSEVGYFRFEIGGVYDGTFTAVDVAKGDCVSGSISNTADGNGKYGCSVGNTAATNYFGRFIPDHFALTPAATPTTAACTLHTGGTATDFTYFGQDGFTTNFTLTAQNAANGTTQNYVGNYAKLDPTSYTAYAFSAATLPTGSSITASSTAPSGTWSSGAAAVTAKHQVSRPSALSGDTLLTVSAKPTDTEGVTLSTTTQIGTTTLRYGRLHLANAYGSALLDLSVFGQVEYFDGNVWKINDADSCTALTTPTVTTTLTTTASYNNPAKAGALGIKLTKPGASGYADLSFPVDATHWPYLLFPSLQTNVKARATFGIPPSKSHVIYRRERY